MFEVEVISGSVLKNKTSQEKIYEIIRYIKERGNKVLVINDPLSPVEEAALIENTMLNVDENFKGVEIAVIREENLSFVEKMASMLGVRKGITVIGPSNVIQQIKQEKNPQRILFSSKYIKSNESNEKHHLDNLQTNTSTKTKESKKHTYEEIKEI